MMKNFFVIIINIIVVIIVIVVIFLLFRFKYGNQNKVMAYIEKIAFDKKDIKKICLENNFIEKKNGKYIATNKGIEFYNAQSNNFTDFYALLISILSITLSIYNLFCKQ